MMRQTDRQSLLFLILGTGFAMLFPVASTVSAVAGGPLQLPLVNGNTVFATNLYHELGTAKGNLFFSPYSVSSALAMTYAGARGKTAEEMKAVLQFQLPQSQLHTAFRQLNEQLLANARGTGQTLRVANGLCLTGGDVNEEFKALLKDHYEAEFFSGGLDKINGWIKQKTDGKIEKVLEKLSKTSACVLLNAIYFKGTWANAFETSATREAPFSVSATKQVAVPLMFQESRFKILKKEEFRAAAIPYRGNRMSMIVLLPQDVSGLTQLEKQLTAQNLRQWLAELDQESAQKTQLFMPKFKLQAGYDLVPPCKDLGIKDAFEPARAEFRGMGSPRGGLCIAQIRHRALVEVNEEGSEAASATVVEMQLPGPPCPVFRADRPFLFLIRDNPTGTILFMGRVVDPTSL